MHLIAPLASGVANAPLGKATLVLRGSATPAPYWTDFEGTAPGPTGVDVNLDSYGSASVYVNALTTVTVKNAAGATVRTFTVGDSAPLVEARTTSFTGQNYAGGAAAPGLPTTLQSILDLWLTNAGSIDWKVLVNGTAYTLSTALSNAALGLVFNVKSTSYAGGAVGDGANNDAPAVAAAITACSTAGGGIVWFPPGTYRLNSSITVPGGVVLMGAGSNLSIIQINQSGGPGFDCTASAVGQRFFGLKVSHVNATAQNQIRFTGTSLRIEECEFSGSNTSTTMIASTGASAIVLNINDSKLSPGNSRKAIDTTSVSAANTRATLNSSLIVAPSSNASQNLIDIPGAITTGCTFDMSSLASGSPRCVNLSNGGIAVGNRWIDAGVSVVWYALRLPEEGTGIFAMESANEFGQGADPLNGHAYDFTATEALLMSRNNRWIEITESVNGGNVTLFMKEFGRCEHVNTSTTAGGSSTILADSLGPRKGTCDVAMWQVSAGANITATASTTWFSTAWAISHDANNDRVYAGRFYMPSHGSLPAANIRWSRENFTRE